VTPVCLSPPPSPRSPFFSLRPPESVFIEIVFPPSRSLLFFGFFFLELPPLSISSFLDYLPFFGPNPPMLNSSFVFSFVSFPRFFPPPKVWCSLSTTLLFLYDRIGQFFFPPPVFLTSFFSEPQFSSWAVSFFSTSVATLPTGTSPNKPLRKP